MANEDSIKSAENNNKSSIKNKYGLIIANKEPDYKNEVTGSAIGNLLFQYVSAVGFGVAGYYLNLNQIDIAFGLSFIFGGFFAFISIRLFGFFPAVLCAAISSAATYELWGHPYAAFTFTLCVAFLAAVHKYRSWPLLMPDVLFWVAAGGPLIWIGFRYGLGMKADAVMTVILKQALNNFFLSMAAVAILVMATQLSAKIKKPDKQYIPRNAITIRSYIGIILVVFSSVPVIVALVIVLNIKSDHILDSAKNEAALLASNLDDALENWRLTILNGAEEKINRLISLKADRILGGDASGHSALLKPDISRNSLVFTSNLYKWVDDESLSRLGSVHNIGTIGAADISDHKGSYVVRDIDVWLPDIVLETSISNMLQVAGSKVIKGASLSGGLLRSGESVDSGPYIVLDDERGQSLMQRWREGSVVAPANLNRIYGGRYNVILPFAPYYQAITDTILTHLLWSIPFIFSMPLLAWLMTANLYGQISLLSLKLRRATETETETEPSVILEINEIIRQTNDFRVQMAAQRASLNKARIEQESVAAELTQLVDMANAPIFGIDAEGNVNEWNQRAEKITGFNKDEVMGRDLVADFITDDYKDSVGEVLKKGLKGEETANYEFPLFTKSGDRVDVLLNSTSRRDGSGHIVGVVGVGQDITELNRVRIEQERERKAATAQIIQASKLATLGEMATSVAHELNQPLNVIRMAAGNSRRKIDSGTADLEYLSVKLERIEGQTARAAAIIDHMRMFGREAKEEIKLIDPRNAVTAALDLMGEQLRLAAIELVTELPEDCPSVLGHPIQMEQVILNLLTNARDAMAEKDGAAKLTLRVFGDIEGVHITCEDTGGGIPEDVLPRIFEPFYTTKEMGKGTGLGLSVSFGMIRDMNGTIAAENIGDGVRFTVTLPIVS